MCLTHYSENGKVFIMFSLNQGLFRFIFPNGGTAGAYWTTYFAFVIISIVAAYLLGSINSSIIISKVLYRDDIRRHGSGNAGTTNMLRTYGKSAALMTLVGDMLKTALAIFICGVLFGFNYVGGVSTGEGFCYMAGLFAVLGHIFPVYYGFKGGKGVLSTATMALVLSPIPFLILFAGFILIVYLSRYVSLGSVCGATLYPVVLHATFVFLFGAQSTPGIASLSSILLAILIVWCHRENLKRISEKTERKLSFKKKPEVTAPIESGENDDE